MPIQSRRVCFGTFAGACAASGLFLTACASEPRAQAREPDPQPVWRGSPTSEALVFATPTLRTVLALEGSEPPSESWAFSRNDLALGVRERAPLLATRQWPEVPPPLERPVWFHRWVQH